MSRWFFITLLLVLLFSSCSGTRPLRPTDIDVPEGFSVDVAVEDLAAPTMVAFDDQGRMLIAESAYGGGGEPKVTRIEPNDIASHTTRQFVLQPLLEPAVVPA